MRIVGGKYKGRMFHPNKKFTARPTTDIAKEGLFNILENRYDFQGKKVLDLFSGTGSIGYEFISRGCVSAVLVEKDFNHFRFIQHVLQNLQISSVKVLRTDVFKFLFVCREKFDFVFADPPYDFPFFKEVPEAVFKSDILNENGIFILEHSKEYDFSNHPKFSEIRNYGKVNFTFFKA